MSAVPRRRPSPGASVKGLGAAAASAALLVLAACADTARQPAAPATPIEASALRPQWSAAQVADHTVAAHLADGPIPWQPAEASALTPGPAGMPAVVVAADGSGQYRRVQEALDALPPRPAGDAGAAARVVVQVKPGIYDERLCLPKGRVPVTLIGDARDPSAVVITGEAYAGLPKAVGAAPHPCLPANANTTHGTLGSSTVVVQADDTQLAHLTIANRAMDAVRFDAPAASGAAAERVGTQAVALTTQADRVQLHGVRLLGHQDTFYVRRPAPGAAARVLVQRSLIAGDVDFVFGNATLVIDDSTLLSRGGRRAPGSGGFVLAPSTPAANRLGFLVTRSRFLAEPGVGEAAIHLGRAWDEATPVANWQPGVSPNGVALVRDSLIGPHIRRAEPWAASTGRRPYASSGPQAARLGEHGNTDLSGPAVAREVLPPTEGWAAAAGGTTGGALALAGDVFTVRTRAELAAALRPHGGNLGSPQRPRLVMVAADIDLATDDQGRPMGEADFADPAFDRAAYEATYAPERWGREDPKGPLEDARARSAKRQAEVVVLKVPSNTSIVGVVAGARLRNGGLLLDRGTDNVILRHLRFSDAYDHFPDWEPRDNGHGEWNSEYDNVALRGATHVWVDHCAFDDGDRPDSAERVAMGRRLQRHDGLLDMTLQTNWVTVGWSTFRNHDKTSLVGSSDSQKADEGTLKITFHHNWYEGTKERTPRVRFGQVHVVNNLFVAAPGYVYSIGVGFQSKVVSEANVWETPVSVPTSQLARWWKGQTFVDRGSLHNGRPVNLLTALQALHPQAGLSDAVGWSPWLRPPRDEAAEVAARVRAGAGPQVR